MEKRRPQAPWICVFCFFVVLIFLYLPMLYLMVGSILEKTSEGVQFTLQWYTEVWRDSVLLDSLKRSLAIGMGSAGIATFLGGMASLALFRTQFRFKRSLELVGLISLIMPELVFALSLLSWFFLLNVELSLMTVMIAHVSLTLSFVIFILNSRLSGMNFSLDEAAQDLGASDRQVMFKVTLPLLKSALAMSFVLSFLLSFDDFLVTFFTAGVGNDTLPIKLYSAMRLGHSPKLNALSTLMILFSIALIGILFRSKGFLDLWKKGTRSFP